MKPVMQTKFGTPATTKNRELWGDCFSACVASILEIELAEVPVWSALEAESWFLEFEKWARERGLGIVVQYPSEGAPWYVSPGVYAIATGKSPRGDWNHSVVVDAEGWVAHDPRPGGVGLDGMAKEIHYLVPLGDAP